jgi:Amt family ammonium transporter
MWGALATGIFASKLVNPAGANGLLNGNPRQFLIQLAAVAASAIWAFGVSTIILKVMDAVVSLRVSPQEEELGLDLSQHGEYAFWAD